MGLYTETGTIGGGIVYRDWDYRRRDCIQRLGLYEVGLYTETGTIGGGIVYRDWDYRRWDCIQRLGL